MWIDVPVIFRLVMIPVQLSVCCLESQFNLLQMEAAATLFLFSLNCLKLQLLLQNGKAHWLDTGMVEIMPFIYLKKNKVNAV